MTCGVYSILLSAVVALLLAGYLGQKFLPPPKPKILGIDLGTTYSCIGAYQAVSGDVNVLMDDQKRRCIPSVVAFLDDGGVLVGYEAQHMKHRNPLNTIYDAKRFIGKHFTRQELDQEQARYPFKLHLSEDGLVSFSLSLSLPSGTVERLVTPEEVGSKILSRLRSTAESRLGVMVSRVVMSVPAEFDDKQRNSTRAAARLAGMEVLRLINEPTAAALAYGLHTRVGVREVMVIDLGGGTLDVSLLDIQGGMFLTRAMAGNNHLGGQDFNERLFQYLLSEMTEQFSGSSFNPHNDPDLLDSLRAAVETAKINLTNDQSTIIEIPLVDQSQTFKRTISRELFESLNVDLFKKVLEPVERVLAEVELRPHDVDSIVLVGGSTRVPKVRELIAEYFGKQPDVSIDPELAVVVGVAVQAGIIGGAWPLAVSALEVPSVRTKIRL